MPICKNCGHDVPGRSIFCPHCGGRLTQDVSDSPVVPDSAGRADNDSVHTDLTEPEKTYNREDRRRDFSEYTIEGHDTRRLPFPPQQDEPDADAPPTWYKPTGILCYIGMFLLFPLPGLGLLAALIVLLVARRKSTRNFAAAVLILRLLLLILGLGGFFLLHWFSPASADALRNWLLAVAGRLTELFPGCIPRF